MTSKKQKERKKKNREKVAKERVLRRRTAIRAMRKEDANKARLERELSPKAQPIVSDPFLKEMQEKTRVDTVKAQIEKNLQLLQALEEEYDREQAARKEINENLEAEGHLTIKEKLDALEQKALEKAGKVDEFVDDISAMSDEEEEAMRKANIDKSMKTKLDALYQASEKSN